MKSFLFSLLVSSAWSSGYAKEPSRCLLELSRMAAGFSQHREISRACRTEACSVIENIQPALISDVLGKIEPTNRRKQSYTYLSRDLQSGETADSDLFEFQINFENGSRHTIEIVMPTDHAEVLGLTNEELAIHIVSNLPYLTVSATKRVELRPLSASFRNFDLGGFEFCDGHADSGGVIRSTMLADPHGFIWLRHLLHEHGHSVGYELFQTFGNGNQAPYPNFWRKLIVLDGYNYVSERAQLNLAEDFADSFAYYLMAAREGKLDKFRSQFPHRSRFLYLLFSGDPITPEGRGAFNDIRFFWRHPITSFSDIWYGFKSDGSPQPLDLPRALSKDLP